MEDIGAQNTKLTGTDSLEALQQNTHNCALVSGNISQGHLKKQKEGRKTNILISIYVTTWRGHKVYMNLVQT